MTDVIDHPENETVIVQIDDTGEPCPCHPGCEKNLFYKSNSLKGIATAHIDEKYGVDVDNVYDIGEMLLPAYKTQYKIVITPSTDLPEDEIHLGYFKLEKL